MLFMELENLIGAIGTPKDWSRDPNTETVSVEMLPKEESRRIIGSVATKEEVDRALDQV